jgi:hypothetical protein
VTGDAASAIAAGGVATGGTTTGDVATGGAATGAAVTGGGRIRGGAIGRSATGGAIGRAATGGAGAGVGAGFTVRLFAAIGLVVLEGAVPEVLAADGVGCGDVDAGFEGVAGRNGICGGVRVPSLSRLRFSEAALTAAGLVTCGGSLARRSSSGSMRSSPEASPGPDVGAGDGAAGVAPTLSPARGSLHASASRGISTGRSGRGSRSERDLGSIMYGGELRQSRRRSCNERASKPTRRLTDRSASLLES